MQLPQLHVEPSALVVHLDHSPDLLLGELLVEELLQGGDQRAVVAVVLPDPTLGVVHRLLQQEQRDAVVVGDELVRL